MFMTDLWQTIVIGKFILINMNIFFKSGRKTSATRPSIMNSNSILFLTKLLILSIFSHWLQISKYIMIRFLFVSRYLGIDQLTNEYVSHVNRNVTVSSRLKNEIWKNQKQNGDTWQEYLGFPVIPILEITNHIHCYQQMYLGLSNRLKSAWGRTKYDPWISLSCDLQITTTFASIIEHQRLITDIQMHASYFLKDLPMFILNAYGMMWNETAIFESLKYSWNYCDSFLLGIMFYSAYTLVSVSLFYIIETCFSLPSPLFPTYSLNDQFARG